MEFHQQTASELKVQHQLFPGSSGYSANYALASTIKSVSSLKQILLSLLSLTPFLPLSIPHLIQLDPYVPIIRGTRLEGLELLPN